MSITYYSDVGDYLKFIEELKKINFLYTKYVECRQKKAWFRGLITIDPLPGNTIRKIDDIYANRNVGYSDTINKLFYEFFIFLKFFKDIDEDEFKENNLYDYSQEILVNLNKKLKKKSCQLPNNGNGHNGNGTRNRNNGNGNNGIGNNITRNTIRSRVISRRNANNTNRSNGSNLISRRRANRRTRRNETARRGINL
jgi:hypothetical protein